MSKTLKIEIQVKIQSIFSFSNLTAESSSLTSLASTLSEQKPENSILCVSDLESQYDSIQEEQNVTAKCFSSGPKIEEKPSVILLRSATKSYGKKKNPNVVLDKFNMTIREGSM